jgi:predicted PurR-regulated permease PerM
MTSIITGLIGFIALIVFFVMAAALANISKNIKNMNRILSTWEQGQRQAQPIAQVEDSIKKNLTNSVTYRNKSTKTVQTVSRDYWENLVKNYGGDNFEIIE